MDADFVILNLHQGDFSTAFNVANTINENFGEGTAVSLDKNSVRVRAPVDPAQKVGFVSLLENLDVEKASPHAKIVINSRTGTIVISGDVKVTPAAVAHGSLSVSVKEDMNVDQADALAVGAGANANAGPAVQNPDTEI